jgi:hypothetical protein
VPKPGYSTPTIKDETLRTLEGISEQINKTVPETITILANLFSRYIGFLKALEGNNPPTTEDLISLVEQLKITTPGEPQKVGP